MAFNIALSGLQAASTDLNVIGNNISNASTVGFKGSRAEFGDLYASGLVAQSNNAVGDGVKVSKVSQQFGQGNITATNSGLDLAINGEGFFIVNSGGKTLYSRDGQFGLDKSGYVVNNQGMRAQGYQADSQGNLNGITGDIKVQQGNEAPKRTTKVTSKVNLDATQTVLAKRGTTLSTNGGSVGNVVSGAGSNGIPAEAWTISYPDGSTAQINTDANASAGSIASTLSQQDGVDASAKTVASIPPSPASNLKNGDKLTINGVPFTIDTSGAGGLANLADSINSSSLIATTAVFDSSNNLQIISSQGADLRMQYAGSGSVAVNSQNGNSQKIDGTAGNNAATVSGEVNFTLDDGVGLSAGTAGVLNNNTGTPFVKNTFNPQDQGTYNYSTSTNIYDSLGNPHVMTQYFVKQSATGPNPANLWTMYVQIDGHNVGDPNTALPAPQNTQPTMASYNLVFNNDGSLNTTLSDPVLISNWVPLDSNGNPNGADGPENVVNGGNLPVAQPPTSSNFQVDMASSTQYGSPSAVNDVTQNGYTTGKLTGLSVSSDGVLSANYSNSQSQVLGQVALAKFNNQQGLAPQSDTTWEQTYDSGTPVIGKPNTSSLGSIQSSSIEESNVDLSKQLVDLITAQRNYQANAKTIQTASTIDQTIINLR